VRVQRGWKHELVSDDAPELSIVIPTYNEQQRLPGTLSALEAYLHAHWPASEAIIVDDGSSDATLRIAREFASENPRFRVLALPHRGKASAVRVGMLAARGRIVLFSDADLSTPLAHTADLVAALRAGADVAIGSREGVGARRIGEPAYRHVMGRAFNAIVRTLAVPGINDTQCGFKAFRQPVAQDLFRRARLYSGERIVSGPRVTGFDVEILYLARKRGYRIIEVPVQWRHVAGSKVQPVRDAARMFGDVAHVRFNALTGRYRRRLDATQVPVRTTRPEE
jgi:glycosyltransferase involved in cell wall biosynthesis